MTEYNLPIILLTTFIISIFMVQILKKLAPHVGLIDNPKNDTRKHHTGKPAQVGGIAIITAALGVLYVVGFEFPRELVFGLIAFLALGVYDDAKQIPAVPKLLLQIFIALIAVTGFGLEINNIGYLVDPNNLFQLANWSIPVTVFCIIAFLNAYNLTDGLDGFAGGMAIITLIIFMKIACAANLFPVHNMLLIFTTALFGFLTLNMRSPFIKRAMVFLGDGGSLALGFLLAWTTITLGNGYIDNQATLPPPLIYIFLLAYPMFDMISVMALRKLKGRSVFAPDNLHLHFLLKSPKRSDEHVCLSLLTLHGVYSAIGLIAWKASLCSLYMILLWGGLAGVHFALYRYFARTEK